MELTTEQIQKIDDRLKKGGIKYWDMRIEMLDHVVTDVENRIEKGEELEKAIINSFIALGWNGSFEELVKRKQIIYQKQCNKIFRKEFLSFFTSFKTMLLFASVLLVCYMFQDNMAIMKVIFFSFIILFSVSLLFSLINYEKVFQSIHLLITFNLLSGLISLLSVSLYFPEVFLNIEKPTANYLAIIIAILFPLFFICYKISFSIYRRINQMHLKLIEE